MISEPLYRTEIDPFEIENFAPEPKLSQFGAVRLVKPKEGGRTVGVPIQKPSEKVLMILLKHS